MKRLLIGVALLLVSVGLLWLGRGSIVASRLESRLEDLGYTCTDLEVEMEGLSLANVAPFSCTSEERSVAEVAFEEPMRVELESLQVQRVFVPSARVGLRRATVQVDMEGDPLMGGSRVHSTVVRLLRVFDTRWAANFQKLEIAELEVTLADHEGVRITVENIQVEPRHSEQAVQIGVGTLQIPAPAGAAISFDELACQVSESDATVEGIVGGEAHLGSLEFHRSWPFRAQVSGLDEERPRLRFERVGEE